jgi:hypothetical protein
VDLDDVAKVYKIVFAQNAFGDNNFQANASQVIFFLGAITGFPVQVLARFVPHAAAGFPLQSRALIAI